VLSRNPRLYSTRRLLEAARERGHVLDVVDTLACTIVVETGRPTLIAGGRELSGYDVVIPRIGASITSYGLAVVGQLERMGVPVANRADAIQRSRDKLKCLQVLAAAGIDVPRTVMARKDADVRESIKRVGGLPAIVKLTQGTQGIGVMIAHSMAEIGSILGTMWDLGQEIILQEFVAESKGRDVRVLVVGGVAVGAMRRTARKGEFRSNLHRGGEGERIALRPDYAACAVRAARELDLDIAGVDLLESAAGPRVMEVNSSPGFEGLEAATKVDIAGLMVEHAASLALGRREARRA
jgi:ribosomal protein S6--L-glutamate ligase